MSKPKQSFLANALKAYIQMKSAKAGSRPQPLESERKLEIRFGISRPTVHQAMEDLTAEGWCLKLPGKRLLYTNPERFNPKIRNIGLLPGDLRSCQFFCQTALSAFIKEFSDNRTFIHFPRLSSQNIDEMVRELENMDFDGFLFLSSGQGETSDLQVFMHRLIADGLPIVAMLTQFSPGSFDLPASHYVPYDFEKTIRERAKQVAAKGYRRVMLVSCSCDLAYFNLHCGNLADPAMLVSTVTEIPQRVPELIRSHQPDLIVVDGDFRRYQVFFQTLEQVSGKIPDLMVYPMAEVYCPGIRRKYRILHIDEEKYEWNRGVSAAQKLIAQMERRENRTSAASNDKTPSETSDISHRKSNRERRHRRTEREQI